jgi:hypothetical protein
MPYEASYYFCSVNTLKTIPYMPIKTPHSLRFTNLLCREKKTKSFLTQIAQLIEWDAVSNILAKYSLGGHSGQGIKAYHR